MFRESSYNPHNAGPKTEPKPQPKPQIEPTPQTQPVPETRPVPVKPHVPTNISIESEALKLYNGETTIEMLRRRKLTPNEISAVIKASHAIVPEIVAGPRPTSREIPHPLLQVIPRVLDRYWSKDRTEADEEDYIQLLSKLRKDPRFLRLLDQYEELITKNDSRTEEYETKAMRDFMELNPKVVVSGTE